MITARAAEQATWQPIAGPGNSPRPAWQHDEPGRFAQGAPIVVSGPGYWRGPGLGSAFHVVRAAVGGFAIRGAGAGDELAGSRVAALRPALPLPGRPRGTRA